MVVMVCRCMHNNESMDQWMGWIDRLHVRTMGGIVSKAMSRSRSPFPDPIFLHLKAPESRTPHSDPPRPLFPSFVFQPQALIRAMAHGGHGTAT